MTVGDEELSRMVSKRGVLTVSTLEHLVSRCDDLGNPVGGNGVFEGPWQVILCSPAPENPASALLKCHGLGFEPAAIEGGYLRRRAACGDTVGAADGKRELARENRTLELCRGRRHLLPEALDCGHLLRHLQARVRCKDLIAVRIEGEGHGAQSATRAYGGRPIGEWRDEAVV